ncbi:MAG: beta-hydroxyacyl-ACP dehydratase [Phycisphaerales bacterium]|nr:beta-hydroxyacyl-ACP dehydratase [Phycisphaerales bacterium]
MAPPFLYDISSVDLNKIVIPIDKIREVLPQRYEFELLSGIVHVDDEIDAAIAVKEITENEFWVRGHIPGRPLMPGVLMIECAAQLCAYRAMQRFPELGFMGFARCNDVIFRGTVVPPTKLYMIARMVESTRRRCVAKCQGINNGTLVFEATITGMGV